MTRVELSSPSRGYIDYIHRTNPTLAQDCTALARRLSQAANRPQAFKIFAEEITRIQGCSCAVFQYDIATQDLIVAGATGRMTGTSLGTTNPTPLLAEVMIKKVPIVIPNLRDLNTVSVAKRLEESQGREFLDTETFRVLIGQRPTEFPRRLVRAALPKDLPTGSVLLYAIPSSIPNFPSQGLVMEQTPSSAGFTPEQIKTGATLAKIFTIETLHLRFGNI